MGDWYGDFEKILKDFRVKKFEKLFLIKHSFKICTHFMILIKFQSFRHITIKNLVKKLFPSESFFIALGYNQLK
jgi:hypothetical protein